jgi:hypothetical protein
MRLMSDDRLSDEIRAMAAIERALAALDEDARGRILRWAVERYQATLLPAHQGTSRVAQKVEGDAGGRGEGAGVAGQYETFAELYSQAAPATDADRVLVGAYWQQAVQGVADLDARSINKELRNLGHAVGHMPSAFEGLLSRRPQPVVQTRKTGKTKQATKRYRLTTEGRRAVEAMLERGPSQ